MQEIFASAAYLIIIAVAAAVFTVFARYMLRRKVSTIAVLLPSKKIAVVKGKPGSKIKVNGRDYVVKSEHILELDKNTYLVLLDENALVSVLPATAEWSEEEIEYYVSVYAKLLAARRIEKERDYFFKITLVIVIAVAVISIAIVVVNYLAIKDITTVLQHTTTTPAALPQPQPPQVLPGGG